MSTLSLLLLTKRFKKYKKIGFVVIKFYNIHLLLSL